MSQDASVYVATRARCGAELESTMKDFQCWNCKVWVKLIWPADDYKGKLTSKSVQQ